MDKKTNTSLYEYISSEVIDGQLPDDFSLPKSYNENEISWMDGAFDGVYIFHMGHSGIADENRGLMEEAVRAASEGKIDTADHLFQELGQKVRAISIIDDLQSYIVENKETLSAGNISEFAIHAALESTDRECVKFGLSLLELFDIEGDEKLKDAVRMLGLSDEFSIFSIFIMLQWEDGNQEIFKLAQKIHGWGRIHAVERIEPDTDEIKKWILHDAVHNKVLPAYSALVCWQKADVAKVLCGDLSREDFSGIRDIIEGLLDEGPVLGISEIENEDRMMIVFLNKAKNMELDLADYEVIRAIRIHYEADEAKNPAILGLCQELLNSDGCRGLVEDAVKNGESLRLAQDLHIDYKGDVLQVLKTAFERKYFLCGEVIKDPEYRLEVLEIFRQNISLDAIKALPTESLGLGVDYEKQHQLECIVQELRAYPLEGIEFVKTALQCAPVRTRNQGLGVLQDWVSAKGISLKKLLPDVFTLLCQLRDIEVNEGVKKRMDELIEGKISFDDRAALQ